jgi:phosphoglycerate dehydrogenase-like enzyme
MIKVAFAGAFASRLLEPVREKLKVECELIDSSDEAGVIPQLGDTKVLVTMAFSRQMAEAAPVLKLVQVPGAGLDRIDRAALGPQTRLANVFGHEAGIAEYIFAAMLALTRSLDRLDRKLRTGIWESQWALGVPAPPLWPELAGKTLGILGYGHIGQALARRARAFDMEVWATRRRTDAARPEELAFLGGPDQLDEVLRRADYLAVTLSLSETTRNLITERELRLMKPGAFVINVARAEIIDEDALYRCLASRVIAGATLDVWYRYPTSSDTTLPANQPFHELDNVLMTPHVAGWTEGTLESRSQLIANNIDRVARGQEPINVIAPNS